MAPFQPLGASRLGVGIESKLSALTKGELVGPMVFGGNFQQGPNRGHCVTWDPDTGEWATLGQGVGTLTGPFADRNVFTMCPWMGSPLGDILIIGGKFFQDGLGAPLSGLCYYDLSDDTIKDFGGGVSGAALFGDTGGNVYDICIFQGNAYIAGSFQNVNALGAPQVINFLARFDGSTWTQPATPGPDFIVRKLYNHNDSILYVGGAFGNIAGLVPNCQKLAMFNGSTWTRFASFPASGFAGVSGLSVAVQNDPAILFETGQTHIMINGQINTIGIGVNAKRNLFFARVGLTTIITPNFYPAPVPTTLAPMGFTLITNMRNLRYRRFSYWCDNFPQTNGGRGINTARALCFGNSALPGGASNPGDFDSVGGVVVNGPGSPVNSIYGDPASNFLYAGGQHVNIGGDTNLRFLSRFNAINGPTGPSSNWEAPANVFTDSGIVTSGTASAVNAMTRFPVPQELVTASYETAAS